MHTGYSFAVTSSDSSKPIPFVARSRKDRVAKRRDRRREEILPTPRDDDLGDGETGRDIVWVHPICQTVRIASSLSDDGINAGVLVLVWGEAG